MIKKKNERVVCADGFNMSIQADEFVYCSPRNNDGPYTAVEIGFPSHHEDLILEFAEDQGITIDSGCRVGNCGTCFTAIKEGDVTYVNEPGSPPEAGSCLACISIPKSNLVIDA